MEHKFLGVLEQSIRKNWELPALTDYQGETIYYKDFAKSIAKLHAYFKAGGVEKGDKIALCGRNSSNWAIAFFGTLSYGAVVVSILHEFDKGSVEYIVDHSDAKVFFADTAIYNKINVEAISQLETVVSLDDFSLLYGQSEGLKAFFANEKDYFSKLFTKDFTANDIDWHKEEDDELAIINYTSGTTSSPKGVMIPYRSVWSNNKFANDNVPFIQSGDDVVCMLPMAHTYGLAFEIIKSLTLGCHVHFLGKVPSPRIIKEEFAKYRPKLVLSVPLIMEKIVTSNVFPAIEKQPVKTLLKVPIVNIFVRKKIRKQLIDFFGGQVGEFVIGGASLNAEVEKFLMSIRFPFTVGYGMTETSPLIGYCSWQEFRSQSCGKVVDRIEVKIDSNNPATEVGEIMVRGTNVMLGYYKNEEATKEVMMDDGWMKTGDLGVIDKDGFIYIKGRNKNLILSAAGQNIFPEEIEEKLNNLPCVQESLAIEEDGKVVALIYPDEDMMKAKNIKPEDYQSYFESKIKGVNENLAAYSQIRSFRIQEEEFEKTPKRSIRRFKYMEGGIKN
ncbi:MAG: long-chain fatty acid--CoA ligase [Bacteroidales bacterium]|jgi:long-chain acyl-CoA synthetase|nr:long-chain fatty acid--CoA ligase [Bacteroidales bacterium]